MAYSSVASEAVGVMKRRRKIESCDTDVRRRKKEWMQRGRYPSPLHVKMGGHNHLTTEQVANCWRVEERKRRDSSDTAVGVSLQSQHDHTVTRWRRNTTREQECSQTGSYPRCPNSGSPRVGGSSCDTPSPSPAGCLSLTPPLHTHARRRTRSRTRSPAGCSPSPPRPSHTTR